MCARGSTRTQSIRATSMPAHHSCFVSSSNCWSDSPRPTTSSSSMRARRSYTRSSRMRFAFGLPSSSTAKGCCMATTQSHVRPQDGTEGLANTLRRDHGAARSQATSERGEDLQFPGQGHLRHVPCRRHPRYWTSILDNNPFKGRVLQRDEAVIHLQAPKPYVLEIMDLLGLRTRKAVGKTSTTTQTKEEGGTSQLDCASHRLYRRVAGTLRWLMPIHPDLSYVSKELSRTPNLLPSTTTPN